MSEQSNPAVKVDVFEVDPLFSGHVTGSGGVDT
jgi:hypothetical protein